MLLAIALRVDQPAMQLGQALDQGQPEPEAAGAPRVRAVGLPERIEQVRHERRRDAASVVPHDDARHFARHVRGQPDVAAFLRELDSVGQQVPHDLLDAVGVAVDLLRAERPRLVQCDPPLGRLRANAVERALQRRAQRERLAREPQLAAHHAGGIEQVFDQPHLLRHAGADARERALDRLRPSASWFSSTYAQLWMPFSGERSSCDTTARN